MPKSKASLYEMPVPESTSKTVTLYLISVGTNDFLENYYTVFPGRSTQFSVDQYQNFLIGIAGDFIREIYRLGARKISLGGLPPMGCLPLERTRRALFGNVCIEEYNTVAMDFNQQDMFSSNPDRLGLMAVQRKGNTNEFYFGESVDAEDDDVSFFGYTLFRKAEKKNPKLKFISKPIREIW